MKKTDESDSGRLREIIGVLRERQILKDRSPENIRLTLEELGSTFVKIGQILSMRPDILPPKYCDEFCKLRTDVVPLPFETVREVIENELSKSIGDVFSEFEEKHLGAASIAQVHRATLKTGEAVVVKVQRPGIRETMEKDIELLRKAARILDLTELGNMIDLNVVIREFWNTTKDEMNFLLEADNLEEFSGNNRDVQYVGCPTVYREFSTEKVLVMECIDGIRIDDSVRLGKAGYDSEEIGKKLAVNYIHQVIDHRFFHADPHPGNLWIRDGQICYIDMGMMGRVSAYEAGCYRNAVGAVADRDFEKLKNAILMLCPPSGRIDEDRMTADLERFVDRYTNMALSELNMAMIVSDMTGLITAYHLKLPANMAMLCRGVVTLEGVLSSVAPTVNIVSVLAEMSVSGFLDDLDIKKEAALLGKDAYSSSRSLVKLPDKLSRALDSLIGGKAKLKMTLADTENTIKAFDDIARRFNSGLISAALIVGSAVLAHSQFAPRPLMWIFMLLGLASGAYALWKKK